jgi:acyl-CoA synthetase (AMP-forming)/AMP-acid ligase II
MLVPVQYQRLMAHPRFDAHDLSSFQYKFSTSAPFNAALKADVLKRWPGGLIEFYGMTEGGGTCILEAHLHPTKLHTVGQPAEGSDIRLIDEEGRELPRNNTDVAGEVVGHSGGMMTGYHRQPEKTRDAEWFDASGKRFIRTGDVGRFDADGFLTLFDRKKDMIISGGGRRALRAMGRDAGGLRGAPRGRQHVRRCAAAMGQRPTRQDAAAGAPPLHRRAAAQRDRQGAQARAA